MSFWLPGSFVYRALLGSFKIWSRLKRCFVAGAVSGAGGLLTELQTTLLQKSKNCSIQRTGMIKPNHTMIKNHDEKNPSQVLAA